MYTAGSYPAQYDDDIGKRVEVIFHYNVQNPVYGTIMRSDSVEPFHTIILLDDGRLVIASQSDCQYRILSDKQQPEKNWRGTLQFHPDAERNLIVSRWF